MKRWSRGRLLPSTDKNGLTMYRFKLQSVLDHRQLLEDNIKKELAEIRQQVIESKHELELMKKKEMNTISELSQKQAEGLSSDGVVAYQVYLMNLSQRMVDQEKKISDFQKQSAAKQEALREAMKKRQILEKLKEQGLERYHQDLLKKERGFIDEIAINQFVRATLIHHGDEE